MGIAHSVLYVGTSFGAAQLLIIGIYSYNSIEPGCQGLRRLSRTCRNVHCQLSFALQARVLIDNIIQLLTVPRPEVAVRFCLRIKQLMIR